MVAHPAAHSAVRQTGTFEEFDVAIVGAGVVGLGHALAAIDRGLSVVVVDRAADISGASIRNFGHACVSAQSGQARAYAERSRELWLRIATETGIWLRTSGAWLVARADDEAAVLADFAAAQNNAEAVAQAAAQAAPEAPTAVELLSAAQMRAAVPALGADVVGGAWMRDDLQLNPREAVPGLARWLATRGVQFRWQSAVRSVKSGVLSTSRGHIAADTIIVAVNHDIDQLFGEVAQAVGIRRCGLDMMRVRVELPAAQPFALPGPLLTGWSMLRYSAFAASPATAALRERLERQHPHLMALDLNQMYTQLPDGSLIVGDTHYRGQSVTPFQQEGAFDALAAITSELFGGARLQVLERWQGVYASGPDEFLVESPLPGVHIVAATTGIGMTCGLGLADSVIAELFEPARA
ncbi:FAD dependent oxidoreductase TIGR03364 [Microterricola gilva]|uniref:FAD dependent oxidoreductase TIGR03364 n=1 Tax=Microterricola gilva TaxID=393267 RepID=A0A4Q8AHP3_9MICO|nr:TIGR03364 family FAD-dependent oxidoreductase [Microterricola gilva]RZU63868.1 FAD dependent oxidoreductase TIGR03364 [Microterricola gilva]